LHRPRPPAAHLVCRRKAWTWQNSAEDFLARLDHLIAG